MVSNQRAWSGWITFAAVMMIIVGLVNVLEGIVTIIYPARTVVVASQLYVVDVRTWGILILAFGAILTCAGIGVLSAQTWARVVAIVFVSLHAIVQVGWLAAYPLWSLLMLGLDVAVLFALTARWRQSAAAREEYVSTGYDPRDRQDVWEQHPRTVV